MDLFQKDIQKIIRGYRPRIYIDLLKDLVKIKIINIETSRNKNQIFIRFGDRIIYNNVQPIYVNLEYVYDGMTSDEMLYVFGEIIDKTLDIRTHITNKYVKLNTVTEYYLKHFLKIKGFYVLTRHSALIYRMKDILKYIQPYIDIINSCKIVYDD